ncbi:hypothetical protein H4R20_006390 [Coemansia guatemalensis]|uniref:TATA-binding protein interacting (TIP20) domain-containing protein n=1 Tax=Coemansia guatemalensis TaxID=2761395 RepID=A0A9W8LNR0_9FUNG|nr:hypothetical protein H4R20_006390 [Coemansia guatemalensis]
MPLLSQYSAAVTAAALDVVSALAEYGADALAGNGDQILQSVIAVVDKTPSAPPASALQALAAVCPSVSEANVQTMISDLLKQLSTATVYDGQSSEALGDLFRAIGRAFPGLTKVCLEEISDSWQQIYAGYAQKRKEANNDVIQVQFPSNSLKSAANSINALYEGYYEAQGTPWTSEYLSKMVRTAPRSTAEIALTCLGLRALGYSAQKDALAQDPELTAQLFAQVGSRHDDVRSEAANALGSYVGSHPSMFPALFSSSTDDSEGTDASRLSKLEAVKVATDRIVGASRDEASTGLMWEQITGYVQSNRGPLPDSLAQSLATIFAVFPETYASLLADHIASPDNSAEVRAFYITTFRTVLADKQLSPECDEQIKRVLTRALAGIDDPNAEIRRLSLLALQTVIQDKAALVENTLATIAPALYRQTVVDESLVRTIRMGPFTRRVDDGLDARWAAYQCVLALVRELPGAVDGSAVVDSVVRGIADEQGIRLVVLQIINESLPVLLADYMAKLDALAESIEKAQGTLLPKKAVKQEIDKHNAIMRSTVALMIALEPVADAVSPKSAAFSKLQEKAVDPGSDKTLAMYYHELVSSDF